MKLILATGNPHKKEELSRILAPHRILIPSDIGVNFDAEEIGTTYLENALIKARALTEAAGGRPVLADDSGISVPALGGAPGIYSARYGSEDTGRELEAPERNDFLLRNMAHLTGNGRRAFFVCCMALILDEYRIFTAQETFGGFIADEPHPGALEHRFDEMVAIMPPSGEFRRRDDDRVDLAPEQGGGAGQSGGDFATRRGTDDEEVHVAPGHTDGASAAIHPTD